MVAFTSAQLPGGIYAITTVEELVDWGVGILTNNSPIDTYRESNNTDKIFRYMRPQLRIPDGDLIWVNRAMTIIDETKAQNLPHWKRVKTYSATNIPDSYKITAAS